MNRVLLVLVFNFITVGLVAQEVFLDSARVKNGHISAEQLLQSLSVESGIRISYQKSLLDSVLVSSRFNGKTDQLEQYLKNVFEPLGYSVFQYSPDHLLLLHNTKIIEDLPIVKSFQQLDYDDTSLKKGLIFAKDLEHNSDGTGANSESSIIEIGNRSMMNSGQSILLVGHVYDMENHSPLVGALVYDKDLMVSATTDIEGFYSLTFPVGRHKVVFQYAGLETAYRNIVIYSNGKLDVDLPVDVIALNEVIIKADRNSNVEQIRAGLTRVDVEETKTVPLVLGEKDIIKIAITTPGIQTIGEGASGFNVRGGKSDQNLMLLNDATVYNSNHFFGFFSAFNADAIKSMDIYKSSIPAKYGGRLSSVFDIHGKPSSLDEFSLTGGISPVTSRLTLDAPIIKNKLGLVFGARTTYSDWVLKKVDDERISENKLAFYDLIGFLDYNISENSKLKFSYYSSGDKFRLTSDSLFTFSDFSYNNSNYSIKWNQLFNAKFGVDMSISTSQYDWKIKFDESPPNAFVQKFDIKDYSGNVNFWFDPNENHLLSFGLTTKLYKINPGSQSALGGESQVVAIDIQQEKGLETAMYFSNEHLISNRLSVVYGGRLVMFNAFGPEVSFEYEDGEPKSVHSRVDTVYRDSGDISKSYLSPEIRLAARYKINDLLSVKLSYDRVTQFLQSISNSSSISPTDTWRLSGQHILPQYSDHISLGIYKYFESSGFNLSAETYYKKIKNLIDFKVGASLQMNKFIETEMLQGKGKAYGVELSLQKEGRLNGWINYTYSRSLIQLNSDFDEETINDGAFYATNYDKPHSINMVGNYKVTKRFSISTNFTFSTGRPLTYPESFYDLNGLQNLNYSDRNAFRIPNYMRVDIGLNLEGNHKVKKLAHSFWTLSVYNLLGRDNPYSVYFKVEEGQVKGYQLIVFATPIPTLTYNFKF